MSKHSIKWHGGDPVVICDGEVVLALPDELFAETRRRAQEEMQAQVNAARDAERAATEAWKRLLGDEAKARAERDDALASVKELEEMVQDFSSSARPVSVASELYAQLDAANADRARLRAALKCHEAITPGDFGCRAETPFDLCPACTALASTDASQWLRERERRVAELVRSYVVTQGRHAYSDELAKSLLALDLAALLKEET